MYIGTPETINSIQVNIGKNINLCDSHSFRTLFSLSVSMLGVLYFYSLNETLLFMEFICQLCGWNLDSYFNSTSKKRWMILSGTGVHFDSLMDFFHKTTHLPWTLHSSLNKQLSVHDQFDFAPLSLLYFSFK